MTRFLLLALLLLPGIANAQGLNFSPPGGESKTKPMITADANTVVHLWFPTDSMKVAVGPAWTPAGTVPVATSTYTKKKRGQAGPTTAVNHWSLGTGDDVLDFAGDFTACAVFVLPPTNAVNGNIISNGQPSDNAGWLFGYATSGSINIITSAAAGAFTLTSTVNTATFPSINVGCVGRSGSTQYVKLNGGTTAPGAGAKTTAATSVAATLGRRPGLYYIPGGLLEFYATTSAWNETAVAALQAAVMAQFK